MRLRALKFHIIDHRLIYGKQRGANRLSKRQSEYPEMLRCAILLAFLFAHLSPAFSFAIISKVRGLSLSRDVSHTPIPKRNTCLSRIVCQEFKIEKAQNFKSIDYIVPNEKVSMQMDDTDSILVAKLRRKIQEAVMMEDYLEASTLQQQLKNVLQKAAKNYFDDPENSEYVSSLVNVGTSLPAVAKSVSTPKFFLLTDAERARIDETDDSIFWGKPRMVVHTDLQFALRLEKLYRERIPLGSSVLDLGASCATFLPDMPFARVVGLGMNMEEMEANEVLTERVLQDLNACCSLPFPDESFDAVICSSTLHYLRNPEAVLAEVRRILRPAGVVIISFSDRFMDSKAIDAWRSRGTIARCDLIAECLSAAGGMTPPQRFLEMSPLTPLSHLVPSARGLCGGDPFAALVSYKGAPPPGWAVRLEDAPHVRVPILGMSVPPLKITPFAAVFLLYVILNHH